MRTIQENIDASVKALEEVKAHPMCGKIEDTGTSFIITYPAGDFGVVYGGILSKYQSCGKIRALEIALDRMERDWKQSFPGARV